VKGPKINGKYTIMAEINMIPFIDVALVLLIIFMVITPVLVKSEIMIRPPVVPRGDTRSSDTPVRVQIAKDGALFVGGKSVPRDTVNVALAGVLPNARNQSLLIEADQDAAFQHVVKVMSAAKELGVVKMAVSVLEEKKKSKRR
jgi:biopolymer transport protein ExbD